MKETAKEKVQAWIEGNFKQGNTEQEDWSMLPGGTIIRDRKGGEALVWWCFLEEKVLIKIKKEEKKS